MDKSSAVKDWLVYIEDDKTKCIRMMHDENDAEIKELCKALGNEILGYCSFVHESDAKFYADTHFR